MALAGGAVLLPLPVAQGATTPCAPVPVLSQFNVIAGSAAAWSIGSVAGRLIAGGNVTLNGTSIGTSLARDLARVDVMAGGNLAASATLVPNGAVTFGGVRSGVGLVAAGSVTKVSPAVDAPATIASLGSRATAWATAPATGRWAVTAATPRTIRFTGTDTAVNRFTIASTELRAAAIVEFDTPSGAANLVSVTGGSYSSGALAVTKVVRGGLATPLGSSVTDTAFRSRLLWSFATATSVQIGPMVAWDGTIVAPAAALSVPAGLLVRGGLVARSVTGAGIATNTVWDSGACLPAGVGPVARLTMTGPTGPVPVGGRAEVAVVATDAIGTPIPAVTIAIAADGAAPLSASVVTDSTGQGRWSWTRSALVDDRVTAATTVEGGSVTSNEVLVEWASGLAWASPSADDALQGTQTLSVAAAGLALGKVVFTIDGTELATVTTPGEAGWATTWDTTSASDGTHTIDAVATLADGVTSAGSTTMIVATRNYPSFDTKIHAARLAGQITAADETITSLGQLLGVPVPAAFDDGNGNDGGGDPSSRLFDILASFDTLNPEDQAVVVNLLNIMRLPQLDAAAVPQSLPAAGSGRARLAAQTAVAQVCPTPVDIVDWIGTIDVGFLRLKLPAVFQTLLDKVNGWMTSASQAVWCRFTLPPSSSTINGVTVAVAPVDIVYTLNVPGSPPANFTLPCDAGAYCAPDYVRYMAQSAQDSAAVYQSLGFQQNESSIRVAVGPFNLPGILHDGVARPVTVPSLRAGLVAVVPSTIVYDARYDEPTDPTRQVGGFTVRHEVFHYVQWSYQNLADYLSHTGWWSEATAEWGDGKVVDYLCPDATTEYVTQPGYDVLTCNPDPAGAPTSIAPLNHLGSLVQRGTPPPSFLHTPAAGLEDAGNSAGFNQPRGYSTLPAATWLSEHVSPNFVRETYEAIHSASQQLPLVGAAVDSVGCNFCIPHDRTALAAIEKTLQTHGTKLSLVNPLMWTALVALGAPGAVRAVSGTASDDKFATSDPRLAAWQTKLAGAPSGAATRWTGSGSIRVTGMKVGGAQFVDVNGDILKRAGTLTASVSQLGGANAFDGTVKLLTWDEGTPALCAVNTQDQPVGDASPRRTASAHIARGITKATLQLSAGSQANATYIIALHFTPLRVSDPDASAAGSGCRESTLNLHARSIAAGGSQTCATTDGATAAAAPTVRCWGINFNGELGDGLTNAFENGPMGSVSLPRPPLKVATGGLNTCAILDDHSVSCWGSNNFGQLGGTDAAVHGPVTIAGITDASDVVIGQQTICVTRTGGTVWCWGWQQFLANGGVVSPPTQIAGLSGSTRLAGSGTTFCAIGAVGQVTCWGDVVPALGATRDSNGNVQLGSYDGTSPDRQARQIAIDRSHVCVLDWSSRVSCGAGAFDGKLVAADLVQIVALDRSSSVAVGNYSICAVRATDGRVRCGRPDFADGPIPRAALAVSDVALPAGVSDLVGGEFHLCARTRSSGSVRCWGDNWAGAVGTLANPLGGQPGNYVPIPEPLFVGVTGQPGASTLCGYARNCF